VKAIRFDIRGCCCSALLIIVVRPEERGRVDSAATISGDGGVHVGGRRRRRVEVDAGHSLGGGQLYFLYIAIVVVVGLGRVFYIELTASAFVAIDVVARMFNGRRMGSSACVMLCSSVFMFMFSDANF